MGLIECLFRLTCMGTFLLAISLIEISYLLRGVPGYIAPVTFINEPTDMSDWGMRTVYLRDPEENLIELFTPLSREQYSQELLEEDKKFQ